MHAVMRACALKLVEYIFEAGEFNLIKRQNF